MRLPRIARPGAIYDASTAAQNFANFKPGNGNEEITNEEKGKKKVLRRISLSRVILNIRHDLEIFAWKFKRSKQGQSA